MKRVLVTVICLLGTTLAAAAETPVDSRIVSVAMFKNGVAMIHRMVEIPGPGTYIMTDVPEPVHGTFWIESNVKVEARATLREVEEALTVEEGVYFQEGLAGRPVILYFREGNIPPVEGTVVKVQHARGKDARNWQYSRSSRDSWTSMSTGDRLAGASFLVVETNAGYAYVDSSMVAYAEVKGKEGKVLRRKPVLILDVGEKTTLRVSYLTRGIAWAPSYLVDITDPDELTIEQKAVIKNELDDIESAEMLLVSGYPSIRFENVTSPFSLRSSWSNFVQQLSRGMRQGPEIFSQSGVAVLDNDADGWVEADISAVPDGEGPDIHYQSIGERDLAQGDSVVLSIDSGRAEYERIVEWIVPDTRDENGRYLSEHRRRELPGGGRDAAWDALRFRNPLPFPMTTAPAMISGNSRFLGQETSSWVNRGEETTLHITKALSIRTRSVEYEVPGERERIFVAGNDYQRTQVKGELSVSNHRNETVKIIIRRRFSGELLEAEGEPKTSLREEGAWSVNKRNELRWTIELKPGEETTLTYTYSLLVDV